MNAKTTIKVRYFEPTYGMRDFIVESEDELKKDREWLDAGGYMYTVTRKVA